MSNSGTKSPTALITNPHLKKVLKTFALSAMSSLSGPGSFQDAWSTEGGTDTIIPTTIRNNTSGGRAIIHTAPPVARTITPNIPIPTSGITKSPRGKNPWEMGKAPFLEQESPTNHPPFPIQPAPLFCQPDQASSERCDAVFEDHKISCFLVGGEKRLCLPQLLNTVLTSRSLEEINAVCDELRIYISRCTSSQLDCLKVSKILPTSAPSCGLITLSDAERLCGALLHRQPDQEFHIANREKCRQIPVVIRCFGELKGTCFLDLFSNPEAACIECRICQGMFSPRHFVLHSHESMEHGFVHWGFDSNNWRHYILIPEESDIGMEAVLKCQPLLEELKSKFNAILGDASKAAATSAFSAAQMAKRETKALSVDGEETCHPSKRIKIEEAVYPHGSLGYGPVGWFIPPSLIRNSGSTTGLITAPNDLSSKFTQSVIPLNNITIVSSAPTQIPSYLSHGPPLVVNPENIVFTSPFDKADDKIQPNIALLPIPRSQSVIQRKPENHPVSTSACSSSAYRDFRDHVSQINQGIGRRGTRSESDDDTSSNSTLSIDFRQETAILEEDEEDINGMLQYVDVDTRTRIVHGIKRLKQRYGNMVLHAQHEKHNVEKDLRYYKVVRKEKIRELKLALAASRHEAAMLKTELSSKTGDLLRFPSQPVDISMTSASAEIAEPMLSPEKKQLTQRIHDLESENEKLISELAALNLSKQTVRKRGAQKPAAIGPKKPRARKISKMEKKEEPVNILSTSSKTEQ